MTEQRNSASCFRQTFVGRLISVCELEIGNQVKWYQCNYTGFPALLPYWAELCQTSLAPSSAPLGPSLGHSLCYLQSVLESKNVKNKKLCTKSPWQLIPKSKDTCLSLVNKHWKYPTAWLKINYNISRLTISQPREKVLPKSFSSFNFQTL